MKNRSLFSYFVVTMLFLASNAESKTHCFCVATSGDSTGKSSPAGTVLKRWPISTTWNTAHMGGQSECRQICSNLASNTSDVGASACANNVSSGTVIRAYAAIGARDYKNVKDLGTVVRTGPDLSCPSGYELVKPGATNFHSSAGFNNTAYCAKTLDMGCPQGYIAESWSGGVKCVLKTVPSTVGSGTCKIQ